MAHNDKIEAQRRSSLHSVPTAEGEIESHMSHESSPEGRPAAGACAWQENTDSCGVCGARFQKRKLTRRHHCRICGLCVCSSCSPSTVQLEGHSKPQRACTPCVANAAKAVAATDRLFRLAERLERGADADGSVAPTSPERCEETTGDHIPEGAPANQARGRRLKDALERCEAAAAPLEDLRARLVAAQARIERAEGEIRNLTAKCAAAEQRGESEVLNRTSIASMSDARSEATPTVRGPQDWQENTLACVLCDAAFSPFKRRHHCRLCGICVCSTCSPENVPIEGYQQPQRACNRCVAQVQEQQASSDAQPPASEQTLAY